MSALSPWSAMSRRRRCPPWSAKVAGFCSGGAASHQMTPSMIDGLTQNVWDEDPITIMGTLLTEAKRPAGHREPPFRRATFLNDCNDPKENPWWLFFGYNPETGCWKGNPSEYIIDEIDGNLELAARADRLMTAMQGGQHPRLATKQSIALVWLGGLCGGHPAQSPPLPPHDRVGAVEEERILPTRCRRRDHGHNGHVGDPTHCNP